MFNIREEDYKVFEQQGYSRKSVNDAYADYVRQGMPDEKIRQRMGLRISAIKDNDSRRLMATDPNISSSEKVNRINAYGTVEQAQYTPENARREYAQQKQAEIAKRKEANPFLHGMNAMFNPAAAANDYYLQKMAENGQVTGSDYLKMVAMGGLTGAGDALSFTGLGSAAKLAQGARAAKAADLAVKARNAGNIARATQLETMAGNLGKADTLGTMWNGAKTFAAPVGAEQYGQVIAGNQDFGTATKNTAIAGIEGAALGALSKAAQPLLSKATKALNPMERVKADLIKQGKEPSKALIDKYIEEHPYLYNLYQTGENTAKGLSTAAIDTAALANMDYGLNTLEGTQQQSYGEHLKNYAPFLAMGGIPAVLGLGKMGARAVGNTKAGRGIKQAISNTVEDSEILSNLTGTGALLSGLKSPKGKAGIYYNVEEGLQRLNDEPTNNLSPKQREDIETANKFSKEENNKLYESFQRKEEPVEEVKQEPEKEPLTQKEINNELNKNKTFDNSEEFRTVYNELENKFKEFEEWQKEYAENNGLQYNDDIKETLKSLKENYTLDELKEINNDFSLEDNKSFVEWKNNKQKSINEANSKFKQLKKEALEEQYKREKELNKEYEDYLNAFEYQHGDKEFYKPMTFDEFVSSKNENSKNKLKETPTTKEQQVQEMTEQVTGKKKRGRPKGSKNKPKEISQPVESDLSPVKNETDVNTPKQDLTPVKSQSDMSGDTTKVVPETKNYTSNQNAKPIVENVNANQLSFDFSKKPQPEQKIVKTNNNTTPKKATQKTVEGSVKAQAEKKANTEEVNAIEKEYNDSIAEAKNKLEQHNVKKPSEAEHKKNKPKRKSFQINRPQKGDFKTYNEYEAALEKWVKNVDYEYKNALKQWKDSYNYSSKKWESDNKKIQEEYNTIEQVANAKKQMDMYKSEKYPKEENFESKEKYQKALNKYNYEYGKLQREYEKAEENYRQYKYNKAKSAISKMHEPVKQFEQKEETDISNFKTTKLKAGEAQGSDYLYKKDKLYDRKTENTTKNVENEKEALENESQVWENGGGERDIENIESEGSVRKYNEFNRDEEPISETAKYVTNKKKYIDFWERYKTLSEKEKGVELKHFYDSLPENEQMEFIDFFRRQEERDAQLARDNYNKDLIVGNKVGEKPDVNNLDETELLSQAINEGKIEVSNNANEYSKLDKYYGNKIINTYFKLKDKDFKDPINAIKSKFNEFKTNKKYSPEVNEERIKEAQETYDNFITAVSRRQEDEMAKEYAVSLVNDIAKKYGVKTKSASGINKKRVNEILDNVKKYTESEQYDKVLTLLTRNKKLLEEQGQYIGNDIVANAYKAMADKKIGDVYEAIEKGDFKKAAAIWEKSKNNIKTAYTDFSIRKRYEFSRETGKKEFKGATWDKGSDVDAGKKDFETLEKYVESEIEKIKQDIAVDYINNNKISEHLQDVEIRASRIAERCPELKPFIVNNPATKITFSNNIGNAGEFSTNNNKITFNINKADKSTKPHEFQHSNDYQEIHDNIDNEDYVIIAKANKIQAVLRQEFRQKSVKNETLYNDLKTLKAKGYSNDDIINHVINKDDVPLVKEGLQHLDNYTSDLIEKRGYIAGKEGKPNGQRLRESIENIKHGNPGEWERLKQLAEEFDKKFPEQQGDNFRRTFNGFTNRRAEQAYEFRQSKQTSLKPYEEEPDILKYSDKEPSKQKRVVAEEKNENSYDLVYDKNDNITGKRDIKLEEIDGVFDKLNEINEQPKINSSDFDKFEKQKIPELRNVSREIDSLSVETGLTTQENVDNRIKQLGNFYTPTESNYRITKDNRIVLDKDYNEKRSKRTGIIEKAKKNKFGDNVNAMAQTTINLYTRLAKLKNLKYVMDNVKKLGKEYKEGAVEKGETAVNSHLLACSIWGNMSREFMEALSKGKIEKLANGNQEKYNYYKELYERTNKPDLIIPDHLLNKLLDGSGETIQEYMQRYGGKNFGAIKKASSEALNIANDFFKRRVLGTASFFINNRLGNQLMIAANSKNPKEYAESVLNAFKLKPKEVPPEILENSIAEAFEGATSRRIYTGYTKVDNFINLLKGVDIDITSLKPGAKRNWAKAANVGIALPNKAYNKIADGILNMNTKFENFERKQLFAQQVERTRRDLIKSTGRRMVTTQEAIKHINETPELRETIIRSIQDVLGDYSKFSKFERKYLKAAIPFYSWYRTITRHTIQLARKNPARFGVIAMQLKKMADDDSDLKSYQRGLGAFRLPIKDARSGKQLVSNKSRQIPWNTFGEVAEPNGKYSMVSPAIRVPIEAAKGSKFFNNSEITNDRYLRIEEYNSNKKAKPTYKYYDIRTGKYLDKLPIAPRAGYVTKEVARDLNPLIFNSTTNFEALAGGVANKFNINMPWDKKQRAEAGNFVDTDKSYDASLGGFNNGDVIGKKWTKKNGYKDITRYAGNNVTQTVKYINRFGTSLGNKTELNKAEREELKKKQEKYNKKRKKAS